MRSPRCLEADEVGRPAGVAMSPRGMSRYPSGWATATFILLALVLTGPAMMGTAALGPERVLDWDPLYRSQPPPPPPPVLANELTAVVIDLPRDLALARGFHHGRLDTWNPLAGCGASLWADHGGPFFPLKLPFYLAPSRFTYNLFLALRLVAAGLGAYCLARFRGLPEAAAIAAGATFELAGTMIWFLPFGSSSPPFVLPWVLLGSFAIAARRTVGAVIGAAVALGIAGHGGHPTLILTVFFAFAAATAGHMVAAWREPRVVLSIAGGAVLAVLLGLALAAPALLPLAELAGLGVTYKDHPIANLFWVISLQTSRQSITSGLLASRWLGTLPAVAMAYPVLPAIGTLGVFAAFSGI